MSTTTIDSVTTKSGVTIGYDRSGSGEPLVLVHGTIADKTHFQAVRPAFEERYTVYNVNRRGREGSSPSAPFELREQAEDVAAVIDSIGGPAHLLGHSFGALCSMEAALLTDNLRTLILYEPPPPGAESSSGWREEIRAHVDGGRPDDAVATFLERGPEVAKEQIAAIRASPAWARMTEQAQSLADEIEAIARYQFEPPRFAHLSIPVLLLFGDQSPPKLGEVIAGLRGVLPQARYVELAGQEHVAHLTAPDMFASEVLRFLDSVEER